MFELGHPSPPAVISPGPIADGRSPFIPVSGDFLMWADKIFMDGFTAKKILYRSNLPPAQHSFALCRLAARRKRLYGYVVSSHPPAAQVILLNRTPAVPFFAVLRIPLRPLRRFRSMTRLIPRLNRFGRL